MKKLEDHELFLLIREGDTLAFAEVVNRYANILQRFIFKRTSCVEDTKDILQEVFASLWNRRESIIITQSLYPYLFKAARYKVIDWMINKKKTIMRSEELQLICTQEIVYTTSEDDFLAKELEILLEMEVNKMPRTMKAVFSLSRKEAKSIKDIAFELSLSEQTVKNNISLALDRLRLKLK